jgi:hypothetical protein
MGDTAVDADEDNGCLNCNQDVGKNALFLGIFARGPRLNRRMNFRYFRRKPRGHI